MKVRVTYAMDPDVEEKLAILSGKNRRSKSSFIETLIMKEWDQVSPFLTPEEIQELKPKLTKTS